MNHAYSIMLMDNIHYIISFNHTSKSYILSFIFVKYSISLLTICLFVLHLEPITYANNGPTGDGFANFGYMARRFYSCVNKTNISICLTTRGYYLTSPFFCSTSRDSLRIKCNVDTSKLFLFT